MKIKKRYVCRECGYITTSWIGKCPECLSWNSFEEELIENQTKNSIIPESNGQLLKINEIEIKENSIIKFDNNEINSFFGDGLVLGSFVLLAGEPGIGKSTFLLYLVNHFPKDKKIFYFSGEESQIQIKRRVDRLGLKSENLYLSNEIEIDKIFEICNKNKPDIIFIDSIQTIYSGNIDSSLGSISQIKYCSEKLSFFSKTNSISTFIVGHITKGGDIAGPKLIEHIVDVVVYFEGDFQNNYRIIRLFKNRFGNTDEIMIFEMKENGLAMVDNPSSFFIEDDLESNSSAKCKCVIIEGKQSIIVEVEALVVPSVYTNARRFSEGVDVARINRIAAILNKHLNENLNNYDIYFNISGGIRTKDVGIDLAIATAIYSSKNKKEISNSSVFIGELSLTGKVRNIVKIEQRIKEAKKFGIKKMFIPENSDINKKEEGIIFLNNISSVIDKFYVK
jgi:DNA repair protein RadA/Sms